MKWRIPSGGGPAIRAFFRRSQRVWSFADRVCPLRFPPGVHKHRSIDDAEKLRERWQEANFSAYWERQRAAGREPKGNESCAPEEDSGAQR